MTGSLAWRAMRAADLAGVVALADAAHPDHPERAEVFAERLALAPAGCLVLAGDGDGVQGYVVSHPWRLTIGPPALNALLGALPAGADVWHLHDVALAPTVRGQGHASAALRLVLEAAAMQGLPRVSLVAVDGKAAYWQRQGFDPLPPGTPGASLAPGLGYGAGALAMLRAAS